MPTTKTKAELLAEAHELGAPVDASNTVAQIEAAIQKCREDDAEDAAGTGGSVDAERAAVLAAMAQAPAPAAQQSDPDGELEAAQARIAELEAQLKADAKAAPKEASKGGKAESDEDAAVGELALTDMSASLLQRLKGAVDAALGNKRKPDRPAPSLREIVGVYPENLEAVKEISAARAGKVLDLEPGRILHYTVRQQRGADGSFFGPKYLRAVDHGGKKYTVEL